MNDRNMEQDQERWWREPAGRRDWERTWGQGDRGAEGYYDHGESELRIGRGDEERYE